MKDVNMVDLKIRDNVLRKKFSDEELLAVKYRWEVSTIVFISLFVLNLLAQWNDKEKLKVSLFSIADLLLVFCFMGLLGRFLPKVHHASLIVLVMVRAGWAMA